MATFRLASADRHAQGMAIEHIPVRSRRGYIVHATALTGGRLNRTLCGKDSHGYLVDEGPVSCIRCLEMRPGKLNTINQDPSGHWRTKLGKLADRLGFSRLEVWKHWSQIALTIEFETPLSRALSEAKAWDVTLASLDKQGATPS